MCMREFARVLSASTNTDLRANMHWAEAGVDPGDLEAWKHFLNLLIHFVLTCCVFSVDVEASVSCSLHSWISLKSQPSRGLVVRILMYLSFLIPAIPIL